MNRTVKLSLLMLTFAASAQAALQKGDQVLSLQGGFAIPISELEFTGSGGSRETFADPGGSTGVQYYYHLLPMLSLGAEMSYSNFGERESDLLLPRFRTESSGHSFDALLMVRGSFIPRGWIHPFVEGGLGISNTALKIEATPDFAYVWADTHTSEKRTVIDSTESGAAILIGGGVDFYLRPSFFIGAAGRFLIYGSRDYNPTAAGVRSGFSKLEGTLATYNMLFRLGWKFGPGEGAATAEPQTRI